VTPVPVTFPDHNEGAPCPSLSGTGDIDTMQVLTSTRTLDTSTTLPLGCLLSAAFAHPSIGTYDTGFCARCPLPSALQGEESANVYIRMSISVLI